MTTDVQYLFLDLNSYFASVEQQENLAYRDRLLAVVPMRAIARGPACPFWVI